MSAGSRLAWVTGYAASAARHFILNARFAAAKLLFKATADTAGFHFMWYAARQNAINSKLFPPMADAEAAEKNFTDEFIILQLGKPKNFLT
ncbi:MAG TPA: hypothetical protein VN426_10315 [Syntrophomonadaceae bacterium]|nr:hypothetical protein [Syntrophomonadaceae bacterium]